MGAFPTTHIEDLEVSRLIIGSNPFFGFSHYSAAKDTWLRRHFTDDLIIEVLTAASGEGLNAFVSSPSQRAAQLLRRHEDATGRQIHWIATPGGADTAEVMQGVRECAQMGVRICMPHVSWTDSHVIVGERKLPGYEEIAGLTRDLGMMPGLSCHHIETVKAVYDGGYDVATFINPVNSIGFLCSVETDWVVKVIRELPTPVICIKPLAAQRILPPTGLQYVFDSIKPTDTVCIGMASPEEVAEDVALAREFITGVEARRQYQATRSKQSLLSDSR